MVGFLARPLRAIARSSFCSVQRSCWSVVHLPRGARTIFDTREYYDRVFGELQDGEVLEWYQTDWAELAPVLAPVLASVSSTNSTASTTAIGDRVSLPRRLLDLGCGTSRLAAQLAGAFEPSRSHHAGISDGGGSNEAYSHIAVSHVVIGVDVSPAAVDVQRKMYRALQQRGLKGDIITAKNAAEVSTQPVQQGSCPIRGPGGPRVRFAEADAAEKLPFRDGCFDVVLEKGFLDALGSTARGAVRTVPVIREAWRVLRRGGVLLSASQGFSPESRHELFIKANLSPPPAMQELSWLARRGVRCYAVRKPHCFVETNE
eukprot:TRINITY_DN62517_c0_g1_i1.p1 TRINITY_DN62517_c0_g1~~TRINITY_DN62517_c0_g1_i1.p1  ORF type:complete len:317 (+),score=49.48 TRINITY_DN62517_c0_g1_i1:234-1184(+)